MKTKLIPVYHVTTFVPPDDLQGLMEGIIAVVPLTYGNYDRVAWWSAEGIEQFRPLKEAKPAVGKANHVKQVRSVRVEFSIPRDRALLEDVLNRGLIPNHPWEEPVVFVDESLATLTQQGKKK